MSEIPFRKQPGTRDRKVPTEGICSNEDIDCSQPMKHERIVLRSLPLFGGPKVWLNGNTQRLEVLPATLMQGEDMRGLSIARSRQRSKSQDVLRVDELLDTSLHIAVIVEKCGVQEPARLRGRQVVIARQCQEDRPVCLSDRSSAQEHMSRKAECTTMR